MEGKEGLMITKTQPVEKARLRFLTDEDVKKLHAATLAVLEETGVTVMHNAGINMLADAGATVDRQSRNVKIPAALVERCLSTASRSFVMAGRAPKNDLLIDSSGKIYNRNGGGPGHVEDIDTGDVREAMLADVRDYARLVDALDDMHIVAPIYAQDTHPATRDIRVLATMFASTSKHVNMRLLHLHSLPFVLRMAEIVAGSKEKLRERPIITILESPIAPLKVPDVLVETLIHCGEYGIPLEICSMPIAGATGPVTLAGSLLMSNVEMLTAIVISQLAHPSAPLVFTPRIMVMDMATGHALTGSIENALLASAGVQLAREAYQIPVNMHGPYTDSLVSDAQAGIENAYFTFMPALSGANILTGAGHLEGGLFVSYAQLLIDNEIAGTVQRAIRGFDVNDETLGIDAVARSYLQGSLLTDPHTLANMRKMGTFRPKLLTRQPRKIWLDKGSKSMRDRAVEMAKSLLKTYEPEPLDAEVVRALGEVIDEAAKLLES
jgi:trimethylamine--corrinoid protein Co-methyltransferase